MAACKLWVTRELTGAAQSWAGARQMGAGRASRNSTGRGCAACGAHRWSAAPPRWPGCWPAPCRTPAGKARLLQGCHRAALLSNIQQAGLGAALEPPRCRCGRPSHSRARGPDPARRVSSPPSAGGQDFQTHKNWTSVVAARATIYAHSKARQLAPSQTPPRAHQPHERVVLPRAQQLCAVDHLHGFRCSIRD
jgi:hypothetical protein